MPRVSLDTNILVYAADNGVGEKNRIAKEVVRSAASSEGILTQQVIGEILNVSRRLEEPDQQRLRRVAVRLCETFPVAPTPRNLLFDAFDRAARYKLQFWDSVIVTVCLAEGVEFLISEDLQDRMKFGTLSVLNPFEPLNQELLRLLQLSDPGTAQ